MPMVESPRKTRRTRHEQFEKQDAAVKKSGTNSYERKDGVALPLADQQTVREIDITEATASR